MPPTEPVAQIGDLWLIGPHRIYCGNARDSLSWEALLANERADIVFADPPYNVPIEGFVSGNGKNKHRDFVMAAGEMSPAEFTAFLRALFRNCLRVSKKGSIYYHCMDWRHIRELLDPADGVYSEHKQLVVWDKGSGGQGGLYRSHQTQGARWADNTIGCAISNWPGSGQTALGSNTYEWTCKITSGHSH